MTDQADVREVAEGICEPWALMEGGIDAMVLEQNMQALQYLIRTAELRTVLTIDGRLPLIERRRVAREFLDATGLPVMRRAADTPEGPQHTAEAWNNLIAEVV